jgi:hypothetical protein
LISSDNKKSGTAGSITVFDAAIGALYTDEATSALWRSRSGDRCAYRFVVLMDEWPSKF